MQCSSGPGEQLWLSPPVILRASQHLPLAKSKEPPSRFLVKFSSKLNPRYHYFIPCNAVGLSCDLPSELAHQRGLALELSCPGPVWSLPMWQSQWTIPAEPWAGQSDMALEFQTRLKLFKEDIEVFLSPAAPLLCFSLLPSPFSLWRSVCWSKWTTQGVNKGGIGEPGRRLPAATEKTQLLQQLSNQPQPGDST